MKNVKYIFPFLSLIILLSCRCSKNENINQEEDTQPVSIDHPQDFSSNIEVYSSDELLNALTRAQPGDTITVHSGTYVFSKAITISHSGSASDKIVLMASPSEERPKFDFSALSENSSNQGVILDANFWHIKGIDIYKAGDNGMKVQGNNNIIEFCTFSECADTGLQIDSGASDNLVLNCDSYYNADSSLENADGFAAKLNVGSGNVFKGCRAWQNLDDGWDGYLRDNDQVISTTYKNCWSFKNGYLKDGTVGKGDGNGFKTGGSDDKNLKHKATYTNCIAVSNLYDGFDHNSNRGVVTILNCSAYDNRTNLNFSSTNALEKLVIKNTAVLGEYGKTNATAKEITNNSWMNAITATEDDFINLDINQLLAARKADGSLPDITFMHLTAGSDLINAGTDVNLPYNGSAPDLGAFEFE
ncbi:MAG: right-handed parallel beta-helix repeat-containing protein [Leeuwenhoekiella sp.]